MRLKYLTTGIAAAALVGAAAAGVTSIASTPSANAAPAVFDVPLPQQPAPAVVAPEELAGVLSTLTDPSVPINAKEGLIENGIPLGTKGRAEKKLQEAAAQGYLPLSYQVSNIVPTPTGATANVVVSGPRMAPVSQPVSFIGPAGGWKITRTSAMSLLQRASASF